MSLAGKASALALAILALSATAGAWAAGEHVLVSGCAWDIDGNRIRNAEVWLTDINNKVDLGGGSVAYTDWDGNFSLMMKKGSPDREEVARITIWSTIAGTRSKERGGFRDDIIARNRGSNPAPFSSPCLTIPASYFVGGRIEGKDPTPRPDGAIRLKVEVKGGGALDHVEYVERLGNDVFETNPWWAKDVPYVVTIDRPPVDEFCWFPDGEGRGKTGDRPLSRAPRFVNEVLVRCKPAPRPPWFVVVGVVTGKDSTMRRGAMLSLKLEPGGGAADSIDMLGNGRVEFKPILQPDTPFKVSVAGQPVDESCEVMPGAPNRTGASPKPGSGKNIIEVQVSCQSTAAAAAPPDLGALPTRPGAGLGNSLASEAVAREDQRQRQRDAEERRREEEERFRRLTATASVELDAECARRGSAFGTAGIQAARQRKALFEGVCAKARQASVQIAEANRIIAADAEADRQARQQAPAPAPASPGQIAASSGGACVPDPELLQRYIDAQAAFTQQTSGTMRPTTQEEATRKFAEFYRRFVENSDARALREDIAERRRQMSRYNESTVVSRMTGAEERVFIQLRECGLRLKESVASGGRATGAVAAAPSSGGSASAVSGNCEAAYAQQEAEFTRINQRRPSNTTTVPSSQTTMYMTRERLALLDRVCRNHPRYAEYAGWSQTYKNTLEGCRRVATSQSDCVPRLAW